MGIEKSIFNRTELLLGSDRMIRISSARVILFGIGGVGSWCAESLVRSGIIHLTLVDSDRICITNINRQSMATIASVGKVKVNVLRERLLAINPSAQIQVFQKIYSAETSASFSLSSYDYIIDAIDSLEHKVHLIQTATSLPRATFFSSMGSALKLDPTRIQVAEFQRVKGCPLASALRRRFRHTVLPSRKFLCVYSEELLTNAGEISTCGTTKCLCPKSLESDGDPELASHEWCSKKAQINGTVAHITAIFGFTLAGLVMMDIGKINQR